MTATSDNAAPDPQQIIAELQCKLDESRAELTARNSAYSERIAYQAAANDVLKVMSASPGDPQPVFDLISVRARDICGAYGVTVCEFDGSLLHWRAATGISEDPAVREANKAAFPTPPTRDLAAGRAILDRATIHMRDHDTEPGLRRFSLTVKSSVAVPLMRGGEPIGTLQMGSRERGGFSDIQVELLKTFADQAVIAIGSAETYRALQTRTTDLQESLQQQTATANVLKVISRSLANAMRICEAQCGAMFSYANGAFQAVSCLGVAPDFETFLRKERVWGLETGMGRAVRTKQPVHVVDTVADGAYANQDPDRMFAVEIGGVRTFVIVPMLKDGELIGAMSLYRRDVRAYTDKQIKLVATFADQAVIAIENTRLFHDVQAKTRDLTESLQQQTATADVLRVISASPGDLTPVFHAMLENAVRLCEANFAMLLLNEKDQFRVVGMWNLPSDYENFLATNPIRINPKIPLGRVVETKQPVHIPDVLQDMSYIEGYPGMVAVADLGGARTLLQVPMLKDDQLVGTIGIYSQEVRPFADKQVALVQNFAAQAVIAIENARLLNELRQRTSDLSKSLDDLRAAQDRLVQTEKLASPGQLTAGIAHEIKNPLNFVNNFSALSAELTDELNDLLKSAALGEKMQGEVDELTGLLKDNLEKVVQHGKRADSIVRNMLLHSREGSGERRPVEINSVLDESLNLAYHGARAEKPGFQHCYAKGLRPGYGSGRCLSPGNHPRPA